MEKHGCWCALWQNPVLASYFVHPTFPLHHPTSPSTAVHFLLLTFSWPPQMNLRACIAACVCVRAYSATNTRLLKRELMCLERERRSAMLGTQDWPRFTLLTAGALITYPIAIRISSTICRHT